MSHFNTKLTGADVPATKEEWDALDADTLAVLLNRDGMLKYDKGLRATYIGNHIRFAQVNNASKGTAVNVYAAGDSAVSVEDRRAAILDACRRELERRELSEPSPNGNGHSGGPGSNGNGSAAQ